MLFRSYYSLWGFQVSRARAPKRRPTEGRKRGTKSPNVSRPVAKTDNSSGVADGLVHVAIDIASSAIEVAGAAAEGCIEVASEIIDSCTDL